MGTSFPGDKCGRNVKLTTHFQLVPKTRKSGSIHPLSYTSSSVVVVVVVVVVVDCCFVDGHSNNK
jgi:hypothetical protein